MKKTFKALKFTIVPFIIVFLFLACDKDFTVLESDVLGEENINFNTDTELLQILSYNKKLDSLQIDGLPSNLLGVYKDPAYGLTSASIVTQIVPSTFSPNFGNNPVIDSVVLNIPYFNRITGTDTSGNSTYTISDSLYGIKSDKTVKPYKLTIYQNNYYLRDFDPSSSFNKQQYYYSKANASINATENFALNGTSVINFDANKGPEILKIDQFIPSSDAIKTSTGTGDTKVTTRSTPALRVFLDKAFWKAAIIDKEGDDVLSNTNNFKNYFRGLYFKAEGIAGDGNMILLNLAASTSSITIYYSKDSSVAGEKVQSSYVLKFTNGHVLNTFINNFSLPLVDGNKTTGDSKLYLKGAEGSMAVVDLFSGTKNYTDKNGITTTIPALDYFLKTYRKTDNNGNYIKDDLTGDFKLKRLINDAQLIVYEDATLETGGNTDYHKYDRLYVYDINNNTPLNDYYIDPTENTQSPYFSKYFHLGPRDTSSDKIKYKIHLTECLNKILVKDSTNTKIGLVLSTNVNTITNSKILNSNDKVTNIPSAAVITPRGTILNGTNVTNDKKMILELFYTEPK